MWLGTDLFLKNIYHVGVDISDAPITYGIAKHFKPSEGPYFGNKRGDADNNGFGDTLAFATSDNAIGINDEDAFVYQALKIDTISNTTPLFIPEIIAEESSYTLSIPIKNAELGDPVRGWIDFNGNGLFEEDEKASATYKNSNAVKLTWRVPLHLNTMLTYLRIRTCKVLYEEQMELPSSIVTTGEVEDYVVRIIKQTVPYSELKEYLNFLPYNGVNGMRQILPIVENLTLGNSQISFKFSGPPIEVIGINNIHEGAITGLRIGHEDTTLINAENPIVIDILATKPLEAANFQLIDIDGGDRIKIEGYMNGVSVPFEINNLTDNYFYQFNAITQQVFGDVFCDAGNDYIMSSSLDMAINVRFRGFINSIRLTYSDDGKETSGTFTIGNFNSRKYNLPPVIFNNVNVVEKENDVNLSWSLKENPSILSYAIERSYDAKTYEVIYSSIVNRLNNPNFSFVDQSLSPIVQCCYYRIKIIETDNHLNYSTVFRMRRKKSISTSGFKIETIDFTNTLSLNLLVDMPGKIKAFIYDYEGTKMGEWVFENKRRGETIQINGLEKYSSNIYYIEIVNSDKKYLIQTYK